LVALRQRGIINDHRKKWADAPIVVSSQDLLERVTLAGRIADILSAPGGREGGLAIARLGLEILLKNLVIEASQRALSVLVLEFNPGNGVIAARSRRALFTKWGKARGLSSRRIQPNGPRRFAKSVDCWWGSSTPLNKFGRNGAGTLP